MQLQLLSMNCLYPTERCPITREFDIVDLNMKFLSHSLSLMPLLRNPISNFHRNPLEAEKTASFFCLYISFLSSFNQRLKIPLNIEKVCDWWNTGARKPGFSTTAVSAESHQNKLRYGHNLFTHFHREVFNLANLKHKTWRKYSVPYLQS